MSHVVSCEAIKGLEDEDEETKACLYDLCMVDTNYALMLLYMMEDIMEDFRSIVVTEDMCPHPCAVGQKFGKWKMLEFKREKKTNFCRSTCIVLNF